jgi:PIN domain nuclease of toxin-antitoxin system
MRILLDTHILLWALTDPQRLDQATAAALIDPANDVRFSTASIWEIAIKHRLGRTDFPNPPDLIAQTARRSGFAELPISLAAAAMVASLPSHHRDPFDHLLLAQAMTEPARLYTADAVLARYSELVTLVG